MEKLSDTVKRLKAENGQLLEELKTAYETMEKVLEQSDRETKIAYQELEEKYTFLQELYEQLSQKENMLIHLEKLSSIGQFVSEIIHELRNPLTVISGTAGLLLMEDLNTQVREKLSRIPEQVTKMSNLLGQFKSMAYKGKENFIHFDINDNLRDFIKTVELIKPKNIKLEAEVALQKIIVYGDPYQLTQIYLNLAKNAFDAMEKKGGYFRIKSSQIDPKAVEETDNNGSIACQDQKSWADICADFDDFVLVEFSDSGTGIPKNILDKVFSDFFTTKERGKGTGLGLTIASDIAQRHRANLAVKSLIDIGTTFQLTIPLSRKKVENRTPINQEEPVSN